MFVAVGLLSRSGTWAEELKTEAAELFDLVAVKVERGVLVGKKLEKIRKTKTVVKNFLEKSCNKII